MFYELNLTGFTVLNFTCFSCSEKVMERRANTLCTGVGKGERLYVYLAGSFFNVANMFPQTTIHCINSFEISF